MLELLLYIGIAYLIGFPVWVLWIISESDSDFHLYDGTKDDIEDWM